jgi:hypothetical protein
MNTNKYTYYKVIQQNWGYGWDDVDFYEVNSQNFFNTKEERQAYKENLRLYRENQPVPTRVIFRKELNAVKI